MTTYSYGPYFPKNLATYYNFPTGVTGAGQKIAFIELNGGFNQSILNAYFTKIGIKCPIVQFVSIDGAINYLESPFGHPEIQGKLGLMGGFTFRTMTDLAVAISLAPGITPIVYMAKNNYQSFINAVNKAVDDNVNIISISWGASEQCWKQFGFLDDMENALKRAADNRISVFASSGDRAGTSIFAPGTMNNGQWQAWTPNGWATGIWATPDKTKPWSNKGGDSMGAGYSKFLRYDPNEIQEICCTNCFLNFMTMYPASSPHVTSCGGTSITVNSTNGFRYSENPHPMSGRGFSSYFDRPDYQKNTINITNSEPGGSFYPGQFNPGLFSNKRAYPDVVAYGDFGIGNTDAPLDPPYGGLVVPIDSFTNFYVVGGTGVSAPIWAALTARLNQKLGRNLGFLNPLLYAGDSDTTNGLIAKGFNDIINYIEQGPSSIFNPYNTNYDFTPKPGWDITTGLGSPNGQALYNYLSTAPTPTPTPTPTIAPTPTPTLTPTITPISSGYLFAWGANTIGQIGISSSLPRINSPVQIGSHTWIAVSAGPSHSGGIRSDGTLWIWGVDALFGTYNRLYDKISGWASSPVQIGTHTWKSLKLFDRGGVAIRSDDTLWAWGFYQKNDKTRNRIGSPVQLAQGEWKFATADRGEFSSAAASGTRIIAIRKDDTVWVWGRTKGLIFQYEDIENLTPIVYSNSNYDNTSNYLNEGFYPIQVSDHTTILSPVQISLTNNIWKHITINKFNDCNTRYGSNYLVDASGNVWASWTWVGDCDLRSGQFVPGYVWLSGSRDGPGAFTKIENLPGWREWKEHDNISIPKIKFIDCSRPYEIGHALAIDFENNLWAWGNNRYGQIGNGLSSSEINFQRPIKIGLDKWKYISAGEYTSLAIKSDDTLWSWGNGFFGQLGNGTFGQGSAFDTRITSPVQIGNNKWISVSISNGDNVIRGNFIFDPVHCLGIMIPPPTPTPTPTRSTPTPTPTQTSTPTPTPTPTRSTPTPTPTPTRFPPSPPTNLNVTSLNRSVYLSWSVPFENYGSPITDYVIQRKLNGRPDEFFTTITDEVSTNTNATIPGVNGTTYVFRVAAKNSVGIGPFSVNSAPVTPSNVPARPNPPTCVAGNSQATLNWTAPANNGAPITNYALQRKINGQPDNTYVDVTKPVSTSTTFVVTGLTNGTSYVFRVAAVNIKGRGAFSNASNPVIPQS